jgi:hypothetical protein
MATKTLHIPIQSNVFESLKAEHILGRDDFNNHLEEAAKDFYKTKTGKEIVS